jgi:pyruvate dehydrogenase E1 component alpha subunit
MLGANGIVGAGPPLATGAALTSHLKGDDTVALAFFGDGAVAQGQIHEAINLAATWDLPAIFLVENNQYGEATPVEKQHNVQHLSETAEAYNIPGFTIDGMDVTAVFEAVREARKRARDGEGPTFIEADTYRYRGHFEGDQQPYRSKEDVAVWQDRDAIETFKRKLVDAGTITEDEFDEMEAEIHERIEQAAADAKEAPYPDPSEAYEDMFSATVPEIDEFARQMRADGGERQ